MLILPAKSTSKNPFEIIQEATEYATKNNVVVEIHLPFRIDLTDQEMPVRFPPGSNAVELVEAYKAGYWYPPVPDWLNEPILREG